jgi:hypothetical protein
MAVGVVGTKRALQLIRFGWAVAELRGRVFYGSDDPGRLSVDTTGATRTGHMPPFGEERSALEQLIETKKVVAGLAAAAAIPTDGSKMADADGHEPSTASQGFARVLQLADLVTWSGDRPSVHRAWNAFSEACYSWDAQIQDFLAASEFGASSAYQLGRGLAETSWSLDIEAGIESTTSWTHLLGVERCLILTGLVVRLTPLSVSSDVSKAIKGSLAK